MLGGAIVRALAARGHRVTAFQRHPAALPGSPGEMEVREVLGDITDASAVARACAGQDAVVHSAAVVSMTGEWPDFERVNVEGTRILLDAARTAGVSRLVHVSSPSVAHAGSALVGACATPADPDRARGNYARSKALAEVAVLEADSPGLRTTAVRPHLVWGPGDTQLIAPILERARSGRLVLIGGGLALVDTTYVDNAAEAIAHAVERADDPAVHGAAFVVSNGEPRTIAEILGRIAAAAGLHPALRSVPFPVALRGARLAERVMSEPPLTGFLVEQLGTAHWFDQRQARAALGWAPRVSLAEGFARLSESLGAPGVASGNGARPD
jgi:nucleoside-diphosphate-sugar epimerase